MSSNLRKQQPNLLDLHDSNGSLSNLRKIKSIKSQCQSIIDYMLNEKGSLRQCSEETGIPRSTVHMRIHTYIKRYYNEDYTQIVKILKFNSKYRRRPRHSWKGRPY